MKSLIKSFIVFEGLDGAGTTTQLWRLEAFYKAQGRDAFITFEPTDNPIGRLVRSVLQKKAETTPEALALLYAADRHDHLYNPEYGLVKKAEGGTIVVSDRYFYSSIAYQSVQCDYDWVKGINQFPSPEAVIFIDTPVDVCMERIGRRGSEKELFEKASYLEKVRENYIRIFSSLPEEVSLLTVDGRGSVEKIEAEIRAFLSNLSL